MRTLRWLLIALVVFWGAGTPGLGIETRTSDSVALGAVYGLAFLLLLIALGTSWKWPKTSASLSVVVGIAAAVLSALDLAGLLDPQRPPMLLAIIEVVVVGLGAAIAWLGWRARAA